MLTIISTWIIDRGYVMSVDDGTATKVVIRELKKEMKTPPKTKRDGGVHHCSLCGRRGHNARTCEVKAIINHRLAQRALQKKGIR